VDDHLFLTGFMGSGKSTIGKALARRLNRRFIDTDDHIEKAMKMAISDIFASRGESWFRDYEEMVVKELVSTSKQAVFSLGGGTLLSAPTRQLILSSGKLIYIKSEPEEIWKRIKHSTRRPLLRPQGQEWEKQEYLERMAVLMHDRQKGYRAAHFHIDRDGKEVDEIVADILERLNIGPG
jgi:shikimate kinase